MRPDSVTQPSPEDAPNDTIGDAPADACPDAPPDAPFVDDYLLYLLARASRVASDQFHAHLVRLGVPVPTWRVLAVLSGAGAVTIGELAAKCLFKQPTLTKTVDRLEADGLVRRQSGSADRRQVYVSITDQGETLVADLIGKAKEHERFILAGLTGRQADQLKSSLRTFIARNTRS